MMNKKIIKPGCYFFLLAIWFCANGCQASSRNPQPLQKSITSNVDKILQRLNQTTTKLKTYQCKIEYKFSQPLFESQTLRKGTLYYQKEDGQSKLRINFETIKQDQENEKKYIEHYLFDGVWLTHIDHQIKAVKKRQLVDPNKPVDAFELVRNNFPLIGFSNTEDLGQEFDITLVGAKAGDLKQSIHLRLKVKPESTYKDDYKLIDFWIDKKLDLPAKIAAVNAEDDIYEIRLLEVKVNKGIGSEVFEVKIPEGFSPVETIPLKKI